MRECEKRAITFNTTTKNRIQERTEKSVQSSAKEREDMWPRRRTNGDINTKALAAQMSVRMVWNQRQCRHERSIREVDVKIDRWERPRVEPQHIV